MLLIALQMVGCRTRIDESRVEEKVLDLVERRLSPVARLSGSGPGPACGPLNAGRVPERFCPGAEAEFSLRTLGKLEQRIRSLEQRLGQAEISHLRGLWTLAWSEEPGDFEEALQLFQLAVEDRPTAKRLNDLAAAHLMRAESDRARDWILALELAEQALDSTPQLVEARWNRALALHGLTLWRDADRAWSELGESEPGWRSAAARFREALPDLSTPPDSRCEALSGDGVDALERRRCSETFLSRWGEHMISGDRDAAAEALHRATALAESLAAAGDRLHLDSVEAIAAAREGEGERLASGHARFGRLRGDSAYAECLDPELERAEAELAGTPFGEWTRIDRAVCAYFDKDFHHAERILQGVHERARSGAYPALEGRAGWLLGLVRMRQARFAEAHDLLAASGRRFEALGERGYAVYLDLALATNLDLLGAAEKAWTYRLRALRQRDAVRDPERAYTLVEEAARALRRQGHRRAALYFLDEQLGAARAAGEGGLDLLAYSHLDRAVFLQELDRPAAALADLDRAASAWRRLPVEHESRQRLEVELDLERALLQAAGCRNGDGAAASLAALDRAHDFFAGRGEAAGDRVEILDLFRRRAEVHLAHGAHDEAEAALRAGLAEVERQRRNAREPADRATFLARARELFTAMIRLQLDVFERPDEALVYLERSANRLLLDQLAAPHALLDQRADALLTRVGETLPPGAVLIRYGHLDDRLLTWTWREEEMELAQIPIGEQELEDLVSAYREGLLAPRQPPGLEDTESRLARLLLPEDLAPGSPLTIVPDDLLAAVPFAALRRSAGEPRLIEEHPLVYAPALALATAPRRPASAIDPLSALFVASPAFPERLYPHLRPLPATRDAVREYIGSYSQATVLTDEDATRRAFVEALPGHRLLHFGGHAVTDYHDPDRGGLLLALDDPAAEDPRAALLTPADLDRPALQALELVVLAACSTGLGTYPETPEVAGLAAAFLAHGVPQVLTAAWPIEDRAAARLFTHFHRLLATGSPAADALRQAQLGLLQASDPDLRRAWAWAGYQLHVGGETSQY